MALTKVRLGDLIELCDARNILQDYKDDSVRGISTEKNFIETKANLNGVNLATYKIVKTGEFAYVADTSRRGDKIAIAYNEGADILISSIYTVFKVVQKNLLDANYLFMYFNRPEFDRFARFHSWGSARETFSWDDFCDIEIELPDLAAQERAVAVYRAMAANRESYERGLADLKLACDAYIDGLRNKYPLQKLGSFIELSEEKNDKLQYGADDVKGISIEKEFIDTKADMEGVSLRPYWIIKPDEFAYVTVTSRNGGKISLAHNHSSNAYICSSSYVAFKVSNTDVLLPSYLEMLFKRDEFDRYTRFHSWGSARETFDWDEMCDVKIPVPEISIQRAIVNIYEAYLLRKEIAERLREQIKNLCPILIKGSLADGAK